MGRERDPSMSGAITRTNRGRLVGHEEADSSATDTARPLLLDVNKFDRDLAACTRPAVPDD